MNSNLTLRRVFLMILACVLLFALTTLSIFSVIAPHLFATIKLDELMPRAQFLVERATEYFISVDQVQLGERSEYQGGPLGLFGTDPRQWGATVFLLDENRNVMVNTGEQPHSDYVANIANFEELVQEVLAGNEVTRLGYIMIPFQASQASNLVFIGLPVFVDGAVKGAVILIKPLDEIVSAMSSLSSALWFSALSVLVIILPFVYWFSRRITLPIRQMRDVALRMAGGDFMVRANEVERGEMGDLAQALNHLSGQLGSTILELTRERNQAVTILNALNEGVLSVNTTGLPMMTNPALQTMLLHSGQDGRPGQLPREVWEEFQIALKENRCTDSTFMLGEVLVRVTITPIIDPNTGRISAVGVFHDETKAHQLEQTRREYVANVSHELRTPLTALRALIEPLRDGLINTEEGRQETYNIILRETMRLSRLVEDMMELSRLQSGRMALEKVRFQPDALIRNTASTYAARAATTGHQLMLSLGDGPVPTVLGNPDRTEQVLIALLNNAFTYTPAGSIITVRTQIGEECLYVTVEDNGPGIKDEDLPNVFQRFYKADKSHGGNTGTGLGLAISREVMERLGEEITVENRSEGGARFTFTLHYR